MDLAELRQRIDALDVRLLELLNERIELAIRTRVQKPACTDTAREQEVVDNALAFGREYPLNRLAPEFITQLFQAVIAESKRVQALSHQLIGFQGAHGAHGDVAARQWGPDLIRVPCLEFSDVLHGVAAGQLDLGIVPLENSLEGPVTQVNDLLFTTALQIVGEIQLPVEHCLLALPADELRDLRVVHSHPQALAQCRAFLERHQLEPRPFFNTAGAARMLAERRPVGAAVIANEICARLYPLRIVRRNIEDHPANSTRFVVLGRVAGDAPGTKCSLAFAAPHESGSLFRVLQVFAEAGIDLTRIASRPLRDDPAQYSFFLDFRGTDRDPEVQAVLARVQEMTTRFNFLGCYPEWSATAG